MTTARRTGEARRRRSRLATPVLLALALATIGRARRDRVRVRGLVWRGNGAGRHDDDHDQGADLLAEHFTVFTYDRRGRGETFDYSQRQWYVMPIEAAKSPATRERRIAKAIGMLREERKR
jgi:Bacteriocin-protection, YdeI or OmpD-Associated